MDEIERTETTTDSSESEESGSDERNLAALARLVFEVGHLKAVPRTGWLLAGVKEAESVAEHSWRTAFIALLLGQLQPEVNCGRLVSMALVHDVPETRTGDVASVGKRYLSSVTNTEVMSDQLLDTEAAISEGLLGLMREYDDRKTPESHLARDADKIDCLAQALQYKSSGRILTQEWVKGSYESLSTEVGRRVAEAIMAASPDGWWHGFVANYRTPQPTSAAAKGPPDEAVTSLTDMRSVRVSNSGEAEPSRRAGEGS